MKPSRSAVPAMTWLLLAAGAGVPLALLWDYSWESTVGIDRVWSPPHVAIFAAVVCAGVTAAMVLFASAPGEGVQLGKWRAPLAAWIALWGALAYVTAFTFDRWWQASYGLAAGIWHPPQLLSTAAFFAIAAAAWIACRRAGGVAFSVAGGAVLALLFMVTLTLNLANRQHSATFYFVACGTYPIVLAAAAVAGPYRLSPTAAALAGMALVGATVWLLPLIPGAPLVAPIYHPRDHLLPPPFPLLLAAPALALDALLRVFPRKAGRAPGWRHAVEAGPMFLFVFCAVQWPFAKFLLSPAADHWFFAGGGKHWPFFLRIAPSAETAFWQTAGDGFTLASGAAAAGLAVLAARLGLGLGSWMRR